MSKPIAWSIVGVCVVVVGAGLLVRGSRSPMKRGPAQASSTVPQVVFRDYTNVRFAYSICYPPQVLMPQGESADGDGQKFVSSDTQAIAIVYGSNNALGQSLQQVFDQDSAGIAVSSKSIDTNTFTFSGTSVSATVMEKTLFRDQKFKTVNLKFPTAIASMYMPIAEHMIACFTNTTPTQYSK